MATNKEIKKTKTKKTTKKASIYRKMFVYMIVVNYGTSEAILKLLKENGSVLQAIQIGEGTFKKGFLNIINMEDNRKDVIFAFCDEGNVDVIRYELEVLFKTNKRYMGFGFTIPLTSLVGEKMYHFLTNTL